MTDDQLDKGNRLKAEIRTIEYERRNLEGVLKVTRLLKLRTSDNIFRVDIPTHAVKDALQGRLTETAAELKKLEAEFSAFLN